MHQNGALNRQGRSPQRTSWFLSLGQENTPTPVRPLLALDHQQFSLPVHAQQPLAGLEEQMRSMCVGASGIVSPLQHNLASVSNGQLSGGSVATPTHQQKLLDLQQLQQVQQLQEMQQLQQLQQLQTVYQQPLTMTGFQPELAQEMSRVPIVSPAESTQNSGFFSSPSTLKGSKTIAMPTLSAANKTFQEVRRMRSNEPAALKPERKIREARRLGILLESVLPENATAQDTTDIVQELLHQYADNPGEARKNQRVADDMLASVSAFFAHHKSIGRRHKNTQDCLNAAGIALSWRAECTPAIVSRVTGADPKTTKNGRRRARDWLPVVIKLLLSRHPSGRTASSH